MKDEVDELLNEVRLLHNQIIQVGESLHTDEPVTLGMRAVLEFLLKDGPMTVPDIARSRSVTRQHIQTIVNSLVDDELVTLETNPLHKRSSLVTLTRGGERIIRRMRKREGHLFEKTKFGSTRKKIQEASNTLRDVRTALSAEEI